MLLEDIYVSALMTPINSRTRELIHPLLCELRDAIATETGRTPEDVQTDCEAMASYLSRKREQ
jgi:hypothetical protein